MKSGRRQSGNRCQAGAWVAGRKPLGVFAWAFGVISLMPLGGGLRCVRAQEVMNLTGLPAYPNLNSAAMDSVARTDTLGHWCNRFAATTYDSLDAVEAWYRKSMAGASETDVTHDAKYRSSPPPAGIKLGIGVDSVVIYRIPNQPLTTIELYKCSA